MVSWREQPTRYDIEALQANIRRVGLVIRVRWVVIVVLVVFSIFGGAMYATRMSVAELASLMWIPALALGFVVLYNTFYALNYRRLGNIAVWNNLQLGLDALVVTVLVYFSGGANSWFWSMYSLFILEAAFILPRSRDTWSQALLSAVLLGGIELLELLGILPHQSIPFASGEFYQDSVFVAVRFLWQVAVLAGTAGVATLLVGEFRRELDERRAQTILDATTGLLSRGYFTRALPGEIRRAQRDGRPVHLILLDIDRFGDFNARFGFDAGDRLLASLAESISKRGDTRERHRDEQPRRAHRGRGVRGLARRVRPGGNAGRRGSRLGARGVVARCRAGHAHRGRGRDGLDRSGDASQGRLDR